MPEPKLMWHFLFKLLLSEIAGLNFTFWGELFLLILYREKGLLRKILRKAMTTCFSQHM